jgi:hypothetical protein
MSQPGKVFNEMHHVGRRGNYLVNYHDGSKTHPDGSPFFDVQLFRNKRKKDQFVRALLRQGYKFTN